QRSTAMLGTRVKRPVALDGAQLLCGISDRRNFDAHRRPPDIGGPRDGHFALRKHEPPMRLASLWSQLGQKLVEKSLRRQIAGQFSQAPPLEAPAPSRDREAVALSHTTAGRQTAIRQPQSQMIGEPFGYLLVRKIDLSSYVRIGRRSAHSS